MANRALVHNDGSADIEFSSRSGDEQYYISGIAKCSPDIDEDQGVEDQECRIVFTIHDRYSQESRLVTYEAEYMQALNGARLTVDHNLLQITRDRIPMSPDFRAVKRQFENLVNQVADVFDRLDECESRNIEWSYSPTDLYVWFERAVNNRF